MQEADIVKAELLAQEMRLHEIEEQVKHAQDLKEDKYAIRNNEDDEDHAGEMETSFGLQYFPHLVAKNEDGTLAADQGARTPLRLEALREGWVSITRPWHLLTTNSGSGYPHAATAEKGERLMQLLVERLGKFLVDLSSEEIDERFPFE